MKEDIEAIFKHYSRAAWTVAIAAYFVGLIVGHYIAASWVL